MSGAGDVWDHAAPGVTSPGAFILKSHGMRGFSAIHHPQVCLKCPLTGVLVG